MHARVVPRMIASGAAGRAWQVGLLVLLTSACRAGSHGESRLTARTPTSEPTTSASPEAPSPSPSPSHDPWRLACAGMQRGAIIDYSPESGGMSSPERAFSEFITRDFRSAPAEEEWSVGEGHPERDDEIWEYVDPATSRRIARVSVVRFADGYVVESFAVCDTETKHWYAPRSASPSGPA